MYKISSSSVYKLIAFILVLTFILSAYIFNWKIIDKIAFGLHDIKFSFRTNTQYKPEPFKDILIVTVDEKSINKHGRWPWNRSIIAQLFSNLNQASIIGLDIVFSERTDPENDIALTNAIEDNDNIIVGFFLRDDATQENPDYELDRLDDFAIHRYTSLSKTIGIKEFKFAESNIPEISEVALAGAFFTTEADIDGLFREYPLTYMFDGNIFPSLGIQILRYYLNKDIKLELDEKGIKELTMGDIHLYNSNKIKLNFYDNITYISASDVISGKIKQSYFKNKIVIVGVTEVGVYDLRPTPMDTITPGVSLHLTVVSNLLQNHILYSSKKIDITIIIIVLIFALIFSLFKNLYFRLSLYAITLSITVASSYYVFCKYNLALSEFFPAFSFIILTMALEVIAFIKTEAKSLEIKKAFSAYVSPEVVNIMTKHPENLKLGGEERDISVIFSDIRGFTTLSEMLTSEQIVYILNKLNDPLTEAILKHEGLLDKYIGDAIMALFNTPIDIEHHADKSCLAALEMVEILHRINIEFEEEGFPIVDIGIGINSGMATVGNMGSKIRFDYTAIGDTVNLSARLEGLNKIYKTRIIISESTLKKLHGSFLYRKLDKVRVKGKNIPIEIYEIMNNTENNNILKTKFEHILGLYFNKHFSDAMGLFNELYVNMNDETSLIFYERCKQYIETPPKKEWDGAFNLTSK